MTLFRCIVLITFFISFETFSQREKIDPISFGMVKLAEDRLPIYLEDFKIEQVGEKVISASLVKNSLQWVRLDQILLVPRVLIEVSFSGEENNYSISYAGQKIIPRFVPRKKIFKAQLFISLFEAQPVAVFEGKKRVAILRVLPKRGELRTSRLIDYSCAPFDVEVSGLEEDLVSVGCRMQRTGVFGEEKPFLEVYFTSAGYRLLDDSAPPYLVNFDQSGLATTTLHNHEGIISELKIKAHLEPRTHRLKLAAGVGPYWLSVKNKDGQREHQIAPTAMFYGNFTLNEKSSFRFFDSYTRNEATFHNWGSYFAWELAEFCDRRCLLTSLIGLQGVDYRYDSQSRTTSEVILPQGFEFVYLHPFGKENYKFSYGMFVSFSAEYDYQNIWIRYGKKTFWEINFIEWKRGNLSASMLGLSFGFPVVSLF